MWLGSPFSLPPPGALKREPEYADLYLLKGNLKAEGLIEVRVQSLLLDSGLLLLKPLAILQQVNLHIGIWRKIVQTAQDWKPATQLHRQEYKAEQPQGKRNQPRIIYDAQRNGWNRGTINISFACLNSAQFWAAFVDLVSFGEANSDNLGPLSF